MHGRDMVFVCGRCRANVAHQAVAGHVVVDDANRGGDGVIRWQVDLDVRAANKVVRQAGHCSLNVNMTAHMWNSVGDGV